MGDMMNLTTEELSMILESLEYTKQAFRNTGIAPHGSYPSYEFKMKRIAEVDHLVAKLRDEKKKS